MADATSQVLAQPLTRLFNETVFRETSLKA